MKDITVDKAKLMETLRANRDEHRSIFLKAQEIYREEVIRILDKNLEDARAGREIVTFISLPQPQDYTAEFDKVIKMLEWEEDDLISLGERDFARYVLNEWEWKAAFAANTSSYVVGGDGWTDRARPTPPQFA